MEAEGTLLFDAGVWVASRDPADRFYDAARELTFDTDRAAAAIDLTYYEVANSILRRWSDAAAAAKACRSIELRCKRNFVRIDSDLVEIVAELALENDLTSYDAAYVAVARRFGWHLVSTDIADLVSKGLAITPDAAV
jgi:predicted nucleic acid-binding protein